MSNTSQIPFSDDSTSSVKAEEGTQNTDPNQRKSSNGPRAFLLLGPETATVVVVLCYSLECRNAQHNVSRSCYGVYSEDYHNVKYYYYVT